MATMRRMQWTGLRIALTGTLVCTLATTLAGCAPTSGEPGEESEVIEESGTRRPDPRYQIRLDRTWLMRGDGFTPGDTELVAHITAPTEATGVRGAINTGSTRYAVQEADGTWTLRIPLARYATGTHTLRIASGGSRYAVQSQTFQITAPLYVVVSTDWDHTRFDDLVLRRIETLRQRHPALVYSHFYAPYHYTDPQVSTARKAAIDAWIKQQRDEHGDEIGVHIHGWCHFVTTAGVGCRTTPSFGPENLDGRLTVLAAYPEAEMRRILAESVRVYDANGLGRPVSFRAGGWTADLSVLRALEATGFTVDSSAMPVHRIASWRGHYLYTWNEQNWAGITDTSQPYYPSTTRISEPSATSAFSLLEVPDNGILVDYITGPEMVAVHDQNAPVGQPLARPTMFQVGFHPPNFDYVYLARMDEALRHVDAHSYASDTGPAVYARVSDLRRVWRQP